MNITAFVDYRAFVAAMGAVAPEMIPLLQVAVKRGAEKVAECARSLAPVDTGHLKSRIRVERSKWDTTGLAYEVISDATQRVSKAGPYPSFQEFGWMQSNGVFNPGHPYLFPCYDKLKFVIEDMLKEAVVGGLTPTFGPVGVIPGGGGGRGQYITGDTPQRQGNAVGGMGGAGSGGKPKYSLSTLIGYAKLQDKIKKSKKIR